MIQTEMLSLVYYKNLTCKISFLVLVLCEKTLKHGVEARNGTRWSQNDCPLQKSSLCLYTNVFI